MTYLRHTADESGKVVIGNYNFNGNWVGDDPDPCTFKQAKRLSSFQQQSRK